MSGTKLIPTNYYSNMGGLLANNINNERYYVFIGDHIENETVPVDTVDNLYINTYNKMIYAKEVANSNVKQLIKKNIWQSNTVYDMYDSSFDLSNNNFYVITHGASSYHVFKCLYNAANTASLYSPTITDVDGSDTPFETGEGYVWKYMYSVTSDDYDDFSTVDYFPIVANTDVISNAVDKMINIITVDFAGRGYDNYCNGTFRTSDIKLNGNPLLYAISTSSTANTTNNYYNDCYMVIVSGTGVGQYARITNYISNSTTKAVYIDRKFGTDLSSDSSFEISPGVTISSDGQQTTDAEARAVINSSGNTISGIEMLNSGAGYNFANTVITVNDVVGVNSNAVIRAINSPPGGHGSNPYEELNSRAVCLGVEFSNTDIDIPTTNIYTQIGILKNPIFSYNTVILNNDQGTFSPGESVYAISKVKISEIAEISLASNAVSVSDGDFLKQLSVGEYIFLQDDTVGQITTVSEITNSSYFTISPNAIFSSSTAFLYKTDARFVGYVSSSELGSVVLKNVEEEVTTDDLLVGYTSGAFGEYDSMLRSNVSKGTNTFVQMYKYIGTKDSGTYSQNERVFQSATGSIDDAYAIGDLHSSLLDNITYTMYVTNQRGVFNPDTTVYGETSGATMTLTTKYDPETVPLSGEIVYIEKIDPITRTDTEKENIKFVFEF